MDISVPWAWLVLRGAMRYQMHLQFINLGKFQILYFLGNSSFQAFWPVKNAIYLRS